MHSTYLLLGSNIGDRQKNLTAAFQALENLTGRIIKASQVYETAAWGKEDQAAFLNQVVLIQTPLTPAALLQETQEIETKLGRIREEKWGARLIDLDLLFYDDLILQTDNLTLPHPQLHLRRFTLMPLAEIAPELRHPVLHKTVADLLENCPDMLEVNIFKPEQ